MRTRLLTLEQGTYQWFRWRQMGLGGSDIPAIIGVSPYDDATPERVVAEKLTGEMQEDNFAMRRGRMLEPVARAAYCEDAGVQVVPVCCESVEHPWVRSSLDGYCSEADCAVKGGFIVEIKAPRWEDHDSTLLGLVPGHHLAQVQWQLLASGAAWCDFVSFNNGKRFVGGRELAVVRVWPDEQRQRELFDSCRPFWARVEAERRTARAS
jgi:putative phage-type endonuclease